MWRLAHRLSLRQLTLAATLLISLATGFLAGPAQVWGQQSGDIRVLSKHHQIDFPHRLTISITLEGDREIVEVKTNYRPAISRVWAYGYAEFSHARQVTASFTIPTSGANYVPPGAQIEYYHEVRDAAGNVYQTDPSFIEYVDTRFQWDRTEIGPLILFHHDLPESRINDLARELDGEISRLEDLLQLEVRQPIRGFLYNGFDEASPTFPNQSQTIAEEQVFHGFAFPGHQTFVGIGTQPRLIVHEAAHLMLAQSLELQGQPIPSWLDEGFATYVEPGSNPYSGRSLSDQGLPLRGMAALSGTPEEINYFYLKAESVVAYLINEHGIESFQGLLDEFRQGRLLDSALVNTYGFDIDGLDAEWAASPEGRASPSPGRQHPASPFLLFNTWFLGGLILVVMALVLIKYFYRKMRPSPEDDDWESPWDS